MTLLFLILFYNIWVITFGRREEYLYNTTYNALLGKEPFHYITHNTIYIHQRWN